MSAWVIRPRYLLCLVTAGTTGCMDQRLGVNWDDASIRIVSPADGVTWTEGIPLPLEAQLVVDGRHSSDALTVSWSSDQDGALAGSGAVTEDVATFVADSLSSGAHTVTVELTDPRNKTATDTIRVDVVANTAPAAELVAPVDGGYLAAGQPIAVQVVVDDDTEPSLDALTLSWTLDGSTVPDAPAHPGADGAAGFTLSAPVLGTHTLAVTVTDGAGLTGATAAAFEVIEADADGDGFVNARLGGDDCDDGDASVHPAATEVCDEEAIDEDCNGLADDEDPGAEGKIELWADADGDTWGAEGSEALACPADDRVTRGGDCDDGDPYVNPDATEVCDDGVDNDCDNDPLECALTGDHGVDVADATVWGAASSDELGAALESGDFNGDGYDDLVLGATGASGTATGGGAAYLLAGPLSPGIVMVEDALPEIWSAQASNDQFGAALSRPEDLDGDGYVDLLIGAPGVDAGRLNVGAVYLAAGPFTGAAAAPALLVEGDQGGGRLGSALDAGDFNCDGTADLLAGEPASNAAYSDAGAAHVWLGPVTAASTSSEAAFSALGTASGDNLGTAVRNVGDISGDGCDDFAIGAPDHDVDYSNDGTLYVFLGSASLSGTRNASAADLSVVGGNAGDKVGEVAAFIGDLDGASHADLAVPVPRRSSDAGAVAIFESPLTTSFPATLDLAAADHLLTGDRPGDRVGSSVHGGADVEADGCTDLLVGADRHENDAAQDNRGAGFYLSCPSSAGGSGALDSLYTARFGGQSAYDEVGATVRFVGDISGDGRADLGVTGPRVDGSAGSSGALFLFFGQGE